MNHLIWPEGRPEGSYSTESSIRARLHLAWQQLVQLWQFRDARRMRWATSMHPLIADDVEEILRRADVTPPPGGWHEGRDIESEHGFGDLHVRTLSVI